MNDADGELSGQIQSRLASAAEGASADRTMALRFVARAGKPEMVTRSDPTPEAAEEVALQLEEPAGPTPG